jgi:4'-phosphopantetheinyl transferase
MTDATRPGDLGYPAGEATWPPPPDAPLLPRDEAHVWSVPLDIQAERRIAFAASLSSDERSRVAHLHFARDRERWIAGRGHLRHILARYLRRDPASLTFRYECACGDPRCAHPHRKPALANYPWLQFNVSHSDGRALIAVTRDRRVGVDLECRRPADNILPLAETICSPAELAMLRTLPEASRAAALYALWTRKEAYLKARGIGLLLAPQEIDTTIAPGESARLLSVSGDSAEASRWFLADLNADPDHAAALASEGDPVTVRYWR